VRSQRVGALADHLRTMWTDGRHRHSLDSGIGENRATQLHLMQSMINMQSLMYGGANGEYNNPRHR